MGKLLGLVTSVVIYLCVGTVLAQLLGATYAWSKGYLDKPKLMSMVEIARGSPPDPEPLREVEAGESAEQPSLEEIEEARSLRARDLELREQALASGLALLRHEHKQLIDEKQQTLQVKATLEARLETLSSGAVATGLENSRLMLENMKPAQAKEQIVLMLAAEEQDEVVAMLTEMPIAKRAKICAEFKTDEELKALSELLRLIRQGVPEKPEVDQARAQLQQLGPQ